MGISLQTIGRKMCNFVNSPCLLLKAVIVKGLVIDISSLTNRKRFSDQQKKVKKAYFYALNIKAQVVSLLNRKLLVTDDTSTW